MANLSIIPTEPSFYWKAVFGNSPAWRKFVYNCPSASKIRDKVFLKTSGFCAYCGNELKDNFVVHHTCYGSVCPCDDDVSCNDCVVDDVCIKYLEPVCKICNFVMQKIVVAEEKKLKKGIVKMENNKQNISRFEELLAEVKRPGIDKVLEYIKKSDFYTAPSSTRYHLACEGGLVQHSLNVYDSLCSLLQDSNSDYAFVVNDKEIVKIKRESVIVVSLLHDLCKTNFYSVEKRNKKIDGVWQEIDFYTIDDKCPYGHGEKSVMMIEQLGLQLTKDERMAIRWHMGFPDDFVGKNTYRTAVEMYPLVLLLHTADMVSSTLLEDEVSNKL